MKRHVWTWGLVTAGLGTLAGLPAVLQPYYQLLLQEMLIWGLFAASFNLLYGFGGMLSFGQAMFFGIGGYAAALLSDRLGVPFLVSIPAGAVSAGLWAAVTGPWVVRLRGHACALMTLILSLVLYYLALSQSWLTGGDDGFPFTVPPLYVGGLCLSMSNFAVSYGTVLVFFSLALGLYLWVVRISAWGRILRAIRDNEDQAALLGYALPWCKYFAWVVAALLAGLAGALYAITFRYANALWFSWTLSGDSVVWTLLGGSGTIGGPFLGTALLMLFKDLVSSWNERAYPLFVGALLMLTVLVCPRGLMDLLNRAYGFLLVLCSRDSLLPREPADFGLPDQSEQPSGKTRWLADVPPTEAVATMPPTVASRSASAPLLRVERLTMAFSERQVLRCVSFEIHGSAEAGATVSDVRPFLVGPNGAGKSLLFEILSGRQRATGGRVFFHDGDGSTIELGALPTWERARRGIAVMLQRPSLFAAMTVRENLWLAVFAKERPVRRFTPCGLRSDTDARVDAVLRWLGLETLADRQAGELSFGQQRLLQLGLALTNRSRLLLLDEPTTGLSVAASERMAQLLMSVSTEAGKKLLGQAPALLIIEHDLGWVRQLASRVLVLHQGELLAGFPGDRRSVAETLHDERVQAAFLGRLGRE